jgi:hydrogenase nickel incorporation protein HypA/HybF
MHELSIAHNILDIIDETFSGNKRFKDKNRYKKLHEVKIQIGELVAVVPESLKFCYECLIEDTPYVNSKLIIEILPVSLMCKNCKYKFKTKKYFFTCPRCQSTDLEVIQGNELKIVYLDVD